MMEVDERARHRLHGQLEQALGPEEAATLMAYLPPVGWADVATKTDLRHEIGTLRTELRGEISELRGEIGEFRAEVRGEIGEFRAEVRAEISELRAEVRGEIGGLRGEIGTREARIYEAIAAQTRTLAISIVMAVLTAVGLALGTTQLI